MFDEAMIASLQGRRSPARQQAAERSGCVKSRHPTQDAATRFAVSRAFPRTMENDYIIPLIVTLITAMIIGAIYLFMLLLRDARSDAKSDSEKQG